MRSTYRSFVVANRKSLARGDKAFVIPMYGEDVSYLTRPYVELSRQMIVKRFQSLAPHQEKTRVEAWLKAIGLADMVAAGK